MNSLKGKVVLITGGSRGIGRAIVDKFCEMDAIVLTTYKSRIDTKYFKSRNVVYFKCDSSDSRRIKIVVEKIVKKFGKIDVLINNAGITKDTLLMRMSEQDWDLVLNTNLKGAFVFCREVSKNMVRNHSGKIINISSIVATTGNAGQSNYVASKAGMIGLTVTLAKELAPYNIQVNAVAPGFVDTDMTSFLTEQQKETILKTGGIKPAKPDKVADFIAFLATPDSDLFTGQTLIVEATRLKKEERIHFKTKI